MAKPPQRRASATDVQHFLQKSKAVREVVSRQPRLLFAIDATASRQPTWDTACHLQRQMFDATRHSTSLAVQLCYFRGFNEFRHSRWLTDGEALASQMASVQCEGGQTQIGRLLRHALAEHSKNPVKAVIFIGDAMEENADALCQLAGQCGLLKLPLFLFQEGDMPAVSRAYKRMAELSGGAFAHFDTLSPAALRALLGAVATFAAGGRNALQNNNSDSAKLLLRQLKP